MDVLRTAGSPYSVVPALKRTVNGINGNMVSFNLESIQDLIKDSVLARRFTRMLLAVFAALAMALATVGIYGVVSHFVTKSTHNIGVRMALGANTRSVLGMVLRSALRMALLGIVIGAAVGFAVTRLMRNLLSELVLAIRSRLPASQYLAAVTMLASYVPAHRATKIDPMVALRYE